MRKTVEIYNSEENVQTGIGDEIKKKGVFRSVILPLLLSLLAAIGIWTYVASENSTISGIPLKAYGEDVLIANGYTIAFEPPSVDIVLSGKTAVIKQVLNDATTISARINIFRSEQQKKDGEYYIFEDETKIKPGTQYVYVEFILPDGVTCAEKEVAVTISEISAKTGGVS